MLVAKFLKHCRQVLVKYPLDCPVWVQQKVDEAGSERRCVLVRFGEGKGFVEAPRHTKFYFFALILLKAQIKVTEVH